MKITAIIPLLASLAFQMRADTLQFPLDLSSLDFSPAAAQKIFLERLEISTQMLGGAVPLEIAKVEAIAAQIEVKTQLNIHRNPRTRDKEHDPAVISDAVVEVISADRYSAIEKGAARLLDTGTAESKPFAIRLLSRTLASRKFQKPLEEALANQTAGSNGNRLDAENPVVFAIAEGLAYLWSTNGMGVLDEILISDSAPAVLQQRAIEAVGALDTALLDKYLPKLMASDNTFVSYFAFDATKRRMGDRFVITNAISRLEKLRARFQTTAALDDDQIALLHSLSVYLFGNAVSGHLAGDDKQRAKKAVDFFARIPEIEIQRSVASLWAYLVTPSDIDVILNLMNSAADDIRGSAALALGNCTPELIKHHAPKLAEMLRSKSKREQSCALRALRIGLGETSGISFSDEQLKSESARVLNAYGL
jgi:hypothetical protein